MIAWFYFWTASFIVSGGAFVIIALIVLVRGIQDLRVMFRNLRHNSEAPGPPPAPGS